MFLLPSKNKNEIQKYILKDQNLIFGLVFAISFYNYSYDMLEYAICYVLFKPFLKYIGWRGVKKVVNLWTKNAVINCFCLIMRYKLTINDQPVSQMESEQTRVWLNL